VTDQEMGDLGERGTDGGRKARQWGQSVHFTQVSSGPPSPGTSALPVALPPTQPCDAHTYKCGSPLGMAMPAAVYQAAMNATVCRPVGGSLCQVGGQEVESGVWAAIKSGSCGPVCQNGTPRPPRS